MLGHVHPMLICGTVWVVWMKPSQQMCGTLPPVAEALNLSLGFLKIQALPGGTSKLRWHLILYHILPTTLQGHPASSDAPQQHISKNVTLALGPAKGGRMHALQRSDYGWLESESHTKEGAHAIW